MAVKQLQPLMSTAGVSSYLSGSPPVTKYTFRQLEELWIGAGGNRLEAAYAAAIALAESKGNPNAEGHNRDGSIDRGLWQINSVHGSLSTTDIAANAKAAVQIHKESGWSPWVTYKTGAYKAYLTPQNLLSGVKAGEAIQDLKITLGSVAGALNKGVESGQQADAELPGPGLSELASLAKVGKLPSLELWGKWGLLGVNIVLLLAGAVLVVYGIMVAVRPAESALSLPKVVAV